MSARRRRANRLAALLRRLLVACSAGFIFAVSVAAERRVIPPVDLSRHSVPLEAIYFDTFQPTNRALPLTAAPRELVERLRDAIPPLHQPRYASTTTVGWLTDDDMVIGYATDRDAWAYPIRILNYHEIVNDTLDGEPILIAYCPLCGSGVVFSRRVSGQVLTFGNTSALYESDMVMLDYETGSYWWHVAGKAIVGTLTGTNLTVLPATTTTWGQWRHMHPYTKVLSQQTGYPRPYGRDPFADYARVLNRGRFAFPVSDAARDGRLPPGTSVLAVKINTDARAYPLEPPGPDVITDRVGGQTVVVFVDAKGKGGAVFRPIARGRELGFRIQNGKYMDRETASIWSLAGIAVDGQLKGTKLPPLPFKTSFWFAIVAAEPTITVYRAKP